MLRDRGSDLSAESIHALTLLATGGDRKAADKAWVKAKERDVFVKE